MKWRIGGHRGHMPPFQNPSYHTLGTRQQVPSPYRICVPLTDLTPIFFSRLLARRRFFFVPRITPPFHYYLLLQNPGSFFDNCGGCMIDYIDIITLSQLHKNSGGGCDALRVPCRALRIGLVIGTARKVVAQTIWLIRCGNRTHQ